MYQLKPLSTAGVPAALHKAERYRLLNDSSAAESICLDILQVDPENQAAVVVLLLSITDQFAEGASDAVRRAQEVVPRLRDEYKRAYYSGIICERRAKALLRQGQMGAGEMAYDWLVEAMVWYEKAEAMRQPGNDEAILRWNTCARILNRSADYVHPSARQLEPVLESE